jgi:CheY-like chemotaxis protein
MDEKLRILIVDDNRALVLAAERVLEKEGFDVITAFDGPEGLEKSRTENPDLIILDILMPEMNGYEVCRNLQADPNTCGIPVIFLSVKGVTDENKGAPAEGLKEINEAFDYGAADFLNKPIKARELIDAVKNALSFRQLLGAG